MWYWSISIALGILRGLLFLGHYMATALLFPQFIWNWCLSFLIYCENSLGFVFFMCWFSLHIDLPITWPSHLSNIFFLFLFHSHIFHYVITWKISEIWLSPILTAYCCIYLVFMMCWHWEPQALLINIFSITALMFSLPSLPSLGYVIHQNYHLTANTLIPDKFQLWLIP